MAKTKKVFLPKWVAWFSLLFVLPVWSLLTYQAFVAAPSPRTPSPVEWALVSVVMVAILVMLFLMGYRRLPAYIIEEEE